MRLTLWCDELTWLIVVLQRFRAGCPEIQTTEQVKVYQSYTASGGPRYTFWDVDGSEVDLPPGIYDIMVQRNRENEISDTTRLVVLLPRLQHSNSIIMMAF